MLVTQFPGAKHAGKLLISTHNLQRYIASVLGQRQPVFLTEIEKYFYRLNNTIYFRDMQPHFSGNIFRGQILLSGRRS